MGIELAAELDILVDLSAEQKSADVSILPTSPYMQSTRIELFSSPRTIPSSTRIKGIGESILSTTKHSPRIARAAEDHPSTAESDKPVPPIPLCMDTPKRKPAVPKKANSVRVSHLPELSVLGSNGGSHIPSTRRSRTEKPPGSKQTARLKNKISPKKYSPFVVCLVQ